MVTTFIPDAVDTPVPTGSGAVRVPNRSGPPSSEKLPVVPPSTRLQAGDEGLQGFREARVHPVPFAKLPDDTEVTRLPPEDPHNELSGRIVSGYRIERKLGSGGMGTVYYATQLKPRRGVALKMLSPELSQYPELAERFEREANALAQVDSPYVVPIYQMFEAFGCLCLTMSFQAGGSVRDLLQRTGRLDLARAAKIARQAALGLQAASAKGIVHRDIKPDNLLLGEDGDVRIADFGLVKAIGPSEDESSSGAVIGTPAYMSPEQFQRGEVDHRSDLYALGCCLFELVTGQMPYPGPEALDHMHQHCEAPIPDPAQQRPEISSAFRRVIMQLLAKNPRERFQDGNELAHVLVALTEPGNASGSAPAIPTIPPPRPPGRLLTPEVLTPPPPGEVTVVTKNPEDEEREKAQAENPPRKSRLLLVLVVLVGLLGGAAFVWAPWDRPDEALLAAVTEARDRTGALADEVAALPQSFAERGLEISRLLSNLELAHSIAADSAEQAGLQVELEAVRSQRDAMLELSGLWEEGGLQGPLLERLQVQSVQADSLLQAGHPEQALQAYMAVHEGYAALLEVEAAHTALRAAQNAQQAWETAVPPALRTQPPAVRAARQGVEWGEDLFAAGQFGKAAEALVNVPAMWQSLHETWQGLQRAQAEADQAQQAWMELIPDDVGSGGAVLASGEQRLAAEQSLADGRLAEARSGFAAVAAAFTSLAEDLRTARTGREQALGLIAAWQQQTHSDFEPAPGRLGLLETWQRAERALEEADLPAACTALEALIGGYRALLDHLPGALAARARVRDVLAEWEAILEQENAEVLRTHQSALRQGIELCAQGELERGSELLAALAEDLEGERTQLAGAREASEQVLVSIRAWNAQFLEVEEGVRSEMDQAMHAYTVGRSLLNSGDYDSAGVTLRRADELLRGCLALGPALIEGRERFPALKERCRTAAARWQATFAPDGGDRPAELVAGMARAEAAWGRSRFHLAVAELEAVLAGYHAGWGGSEPDWAVAQGQHTVAAAQELPVALTSPQGLRLALVPPGPLTMGSNTSGDDRGFRESDESAHQVSISQPTYVGVTEVTQRQWQAVMQSAPAFFGHAGQDAPIETISWYDAVEFCNRLSRLEGLQEVYAIEEIERDGATLISARVSLRGLQLSGYRLPTEAEWEYACRAGAQTAIFAGTLEGASDFFCDALAEIAWFAGNSRASYQGSIDLAEIYGGASLTELLRLGSTQSGPQLVGQKLPNAFGLRDTLGNVAEWCWDGYARYPEAPATDPVGPAEADRRVIRGGSWSSRAGSCRAAARGSQTPDAGSTTVGFRVVRGIP